MTWNYRIAKREYKTDTGEITDISYFIVEAYYDENGKVVGISQDPQAPYGESLKELLHNCVMFFEAFKAPVLDYDQVPEPGAIDLLKAPSEEEIKQMVEEEKLEPFEPIRFTKEEYDEYKKSERIRINKENKEIEETVLGKPIPIIIAKAVESYFSKE